MQNNTEIKTDLDAFIFIKNKLMEQGARSINHDDECQYRGFSNKLLEDIELQVDKMVNSQIDEEGFEFEFGSEIHWDLESAARFKITSEIPYDMKCAVGHLISDDFYDPAFEGEGIVGNETILEAIANSNPHWQMGESSENMVSVLQAVHDQREVYEWEKFFKIIESKIDPTTKTYTGPQDIREIANENN